MFSQRELAVIAKGLENVILEYSRFPSSLLPQEADDLLSNLTQFTDDHTSPNTSTDSATAYQQQHIPGGGK
jgi:hypothetical protein